MPERPGRARSGRPGLNGLLAEAERDRPGALDAVKDTTNMPPDAEPSSAKSDLRFPDNLLMSQTAPTGRADAGLSAPG